MVSSFPSTPTRSAGGIFAAGESLGRPDAFLARELADGVVHFLTLECEGTTPTTEQIAEVVIKVVRELGQPPLAEAFARFRTTRVQPRGKTQAVEEAPSAEVVVRFSPSAPLSSVVPTCVPSTPCKPSSHAIWQQPRSAGLLILTGLDAPEELSGCVLRPPLEAGTGPIAAIEDLRRFVGHYIVLDGPEHFLATNDRLSAPEFVRDLSLGLRLARLGGIVNLNSAAPPSWAGELAEGPLFAAQQRKPHSERLRELSDELAKELLRPAHSIACAGALRVDWHLSEEDFTAEPARRERIRQMARLALEGAPLAFVLDRPRRPVALAEGIDRQHPAVLLAVGLHLPQLALQPGIDGDAAKFLSKLGSLARGWLSRRRTETRISPQPGEKSVASDLRLTRPHQRLSPRPRAFAGRAGGAG